MRTNVKTATIVNQMMRGLKNRDRKIAPEPVCEAFKQRYQGTIEWVEKSLPSCLPAAIYGVVGKCCLWYGRDKIEPFCQALKNYKFNGTDDPAYLFYQWLTLNRSKIVTRDCYRRTVCAARASCEGRKPKYLRPSQEDIFDWDVSYTIMLKPIFNQYGNNKFKSRYAPADNDTEIPKS